MKSIYDLTKNDLEEYFISIGSKKFHADQLFDWLYVKRIKSFNEVTNIKKDILEKIEKNYKLNDIKIVKIEKDKDVNKYLFELSDKEHIEAVLMFHDYGTSICISSQVGCNMGCKFCESGRRKKVRNLEVYEMVMQILMIEEELKERISHVVVMGIGEPFDNYDNLVKFFRIINDPKGISIGARHITVSTCGIIPKIEEFSNLDMQINLAISLHAANDELRNKIMPINKAYPLKDLMKAIKKYVNCYINLIPYNETNNIEFKRTNTIQIMRFYDILKKNKINVTIRREFGSNISAACGQLRSKKEEL